VPISILESLVVALPPILSPLSRTFAELTLINWRRPWGSRRLDFVIRAGSFNFLHRQNQQILWLPTAVRSLLVGSSATIYINNRQVHRHIIHLRTKVYRLLVRLWQIDGINSRRNQCVSESAVLTSQSVEVPRSRATNHEDLDWI
jgi:hypothetical protein